MTPSVSPELRTDRLLLRRFTADDLAAIHGYARDPEVVRYMPWGPNSLSQTRAFLRQVLKTYGSGAGEDHPFAVTLLQDGSLIGGCEISRQPNPDNREWMIGYCLHRGHWGRGYGCELARALICFGFGELGCHRIVATCDPRNVGSWRVMEKAGMRREGLLREHKWQKGAWRDSYIYSILECEWQATESETSS